MKATSLLFLILIVSTSYAQKKPTKQETQKSIYGSVERILYLHNQHYLAQEIYTYSVAWVYRQGSQEDRYALATVLFTKLPAAREPGIKTATYDSIKNGVIRLAALAEVNMQQLARFEDVYDSADNLTEKAIQARQRIDKDISTQFRMVMPTIQRQLTVEKQALNATLAGSTVPKGMADMVTATLQSVEVITKARAMNLNIYAGTLNWIFRPEDIEAKAALMKDLETPVALANKNAVEPIMTQLELTRIEELLTANQGLCENGITSIKTEQDYEDPIKRLMAEDLIESEMMPKVTEISLRSDSLLSGRIDNLKIAVADDQIRKEDDIRRMLRGHVLIQQYLISSEKKYPSLKQDELIELVVPIYAKRFSHKEIREILEFQKSSTGKKMQQQATVISLEIIEALNTYLSQLKAEKP